ncbi:MAG: flagellar hook protein FlgE [bacterium]|nr:flagellar hook protein FlgE [bacterium]
MMRSLYSGVSGLKAHQTKMDVIGNNIANVNTVGYKASSVRFADTLYQTTQAASGANAITGKAGTNAKQIGLGVSISNITKSMSTAGGTQTTDDALDLVINGDNFFIVNNGGTNYFTKAGAFTVDSSGYLVNYSGNYVMGWQPDQTDPTQIAVDSVSKLQIMSPDKVTAPPESTTAATLTGNIDMNDKTIASTGRVTQYSFYDKMGNKYTAKLNFVQNAENTNQYSVSVTDILDVNGRSIFAVYNDAGEQTGPSTVSMNFGSQTDIKGTMDDTTGKIVVESKPISLVFNSSTGKFESADGATSEVNLSITSTANNFDTMGIDFTKMTMFANGGTSAISASAGDSAGRNAGKTSGEMTGLSIDGSGKIYGSYDNGSTVLLGQVAVTSFSNAAGLEAVGDNLFAETLNSGTFDGIGKDATTGGGSLTSGALEMSNVDLSAEFTDMITTQRGFQANSRIITTSDSLLEELINLKR